MALKTKNLIFLNGSQCNWEILHFFVGSVWCDDGCSCGSGGYCGSVCDVGGGDGGGGGGVGGGVGGGGGGGDVVCGGDGYCRGGSSDRCANLS